MRIDPNLPASESTQTTRVNDQRAGTPNSLPGNSSAALNDTVQLSPNQAKLRQLSAQLNQVPDVRSQQVDALRSQVQSGTFSRSNDAVASAVVNDLFGPAA
jgi:flagellar biosynthesis anti-sigma factor FlgM